MTNTQSTDLLTLTANIVAAYVRYNGVRSGELSDVIVSVHSALANKQPVPQVKPVPAVDPQNSVFPDYIVSLEDGRKVKLLKLHLNRLGMTPEQYRAKWELPITYPMVAPNYSKRRSQLSKISRTWL